jgi:hypothetical protein
MATLTRRVNRRWHRIRFQIGDRRWKARSTKSRIAPRSTSPVSYRDGLELSHDGRRLIFSAQQSLSANKTYDIYITDRDLS